MRFTTPLILYFLLNISFFQFAWSQQADLDSLREVLPSSTGIERVDILNELATQLREIASQDAMDYSKESEQLSEQLDYLAGAARAKENIGWIYYRKGRWQLAFEYSEKAYQLALEIKDKNQSARILNNMGALYYEQQNYQMAIKQFRAAYEIVAGTDDLYTQIRSLNNVAFNYSQIGVYDSALYYARKAIQTNEESGSPYLTSFSNRVIGDVYMARQEYDSAVMIFEKSLDMAREQGISTFKASVMHRLGNAYLELGRWKDAEEILLEGILLSANNNFRDELAKSHKYLAKVYEERGEIALAYRHLKDYNLINDSLVDQSLRDRIALMQGMFQDNLEKSELELLKAQNQNQADRLVLVNRIVWVVSIAGLLVFILGGWLYRLNRNVKKYNKDLIFQQQKIAEQNRALEQKSLQLEKINQTKNKLFSILGHDLRGPIGSVKGLIDLTLEGSISQEEFMEILNTLKKDVDSVHFTLTNTLKWSLAQMEGFKVNPVQVDVNELIESNIQLLAQQIHAKSLKINNEMPNDLILTIDKDLIEVITRNILSNAVKFSPEFGEINIHFQHTREDVLWCVEDQGKGMNQEEIENILAHDYTITKSKPGTKKEKGSGLGLQVCKEFARLSNGSLTIASQAGSGSKVCLRLPINVLRNQSQAISD